MSEKLLNLINGHISRLVTNRQTNANAMSSGCAPASVSAEASSVGLKQMIKRHTAGILQDQNRPVPMSGNFNRLSSSGRIELSCKRIFVLEAFEDFR